MPRLPARAAAPLVALAASALASCYASHAPSSSTADAGPPRGRDAGPPPVDASPPDAGQDAGSPRAPQLVWVLVHPSDAPTGPGLYLFDEANQEVLRRLPLPAGARSPQALAWDGASLWLGGAEESARVRELDPDDGTVRSTWPTSIRTEGLANEGDRFWYVDPGSAMGGLVEVTRDGTPVRALGLPETVFQDLVAADGALYYLVNDGLDRIMRVDPEAGAVTELARGVDPAPYALGFDGTHLVVAARGNARRFDPDTGALVGESPFAIPGWITAIAYAR